MPAPKDRQIMYTVKVGNTLLDVTGRKRTVKGYILVCIHDHPNSDSLGYVMEHRLVKEIEIGRFLDQHKSVHHKNGIKHDNRISNLEIIDPVDHTRLHHIGATRSSKTRKNMSEVAKRRFADKTNHPSYKDIDDQLVLLVKQGEKASQIAKKLGVSRKTVYNKIQYLGMEEVYFDK